MSATDTRPLAVVTGASSGIGLELAKQFAANGFDLLVAAEDDELAGRPRALEACRVTVEAARGAPAPAGGVEALYEPIRAAGRPVGAAALNAGIGAGGAFASDTEL